MKRRFRRLVLLVILIIVATPLLTVVGVFSYFYINQHGLKNQIVEFVNNAQPGEISIEEIDLSLFHDFPNVSLECIDVIFRGLLVSTDSMVAKEIFSAEQIYASINLNALWRGKVSINELSMSRGDFYVEVFEDTTLNLEKAFGKNMMKEAEPSIGVQGEKQIDFRMEELHLEDMQVHLRNRVIGTTWHGLLDLQAALGYQNDIVTSHHTIRVRGFHFERDHQTRVENLELSIVNDLEIDLGRNLYRIHKSEVSFDRIKAGISGFYDSKNDLGDFQFLVDHSNFGQLLSEALWNRDFEFSEEEFGSIRIEGSVKGPLISSYPILEVSIRGDKIRIENPRGRGPIRHIKIQAQASSGHGPDFLDGYLDLEHISAAFPAGLVQGEVFIRDFQKPNFGIRWNSSFRLDGMERLVRSEDIDSLFGKVNVEMDLKGEFDLVKQELMDLSGHGSMTFEDVSMYFTEYDYSLDNARGRFFMEKGHVGVDSLVITKGKSQLKMDGTLSNPLLYILGYETPVEADLTLSSGLFNIMEALQTDSTLGNIMGEELANLNVNLHYKTDSEGLNNERLLPYGSVTINDLSVIVRNKTSLRNVSGTMIISPDSVALLELSGSKDSTDFLMGAGITNYHDVMRPDTTSDIRLDFGMEGKRLRFQDFFQIYGKDPIPPPYNTETIRDYHFRGTVKISNQELLGNNQFPEFRFEVKDLSGTLTNNPLEFKRFRLDIEAKGDTLLIHELDAVIGKSDFLLAGQIVDNSAPEDSTLNLKDLQGEIQLISQLLDLNQLMDIPVPESEDEGATSISYQYPEFLMDVEIGHLEYFHYRPTGIVGKLQIHKPNQFVLDRLEYSTPAGTVVLSGKADLSDSTLIWVDASIEVQRLDLGRINAAFIYDNDSIRVQDHFAGTLSGHLNSKMKLYLDGTVDLDDFSSTLEGRLDSGRIMNFPALQTLSDYFGNKDLANVRFASITNTIDVRNNQIKIPKMQISSTLGSLRIEGGQDFDGNLDYVVEVPFKLVKSAAWNSLVNRKRKKNATEDEIQTYEGKRYVTLRIGGTMDEPDIKIGKGKRR